MEMYVEGVSSRKVKEITEELCGTHTSFSKSLVSPLFGRQPRRGASSLEEEEPSRGKGLPLPLRRCPLGEGESGPQGRQPGRARRLGGEVRWRRAARDPRRGGSRERFNQEIKRRTRVVRIFPNRESCLRLVTALAIEQSEEWVTRRRYLEMREIEEYLSARSGKWRGRCSWSDRGGTGLGGDYRNFGT